MLPRPLALLGLLDTFLAGCGVVVMRCTFWLERCATPRAEPFGLATLEDRTESHSGIFPFRVTTV